MFQADIQAGFVATKSGWCCSHDQHANRTSAFYRQYKGSCDAHLARRKRRPPVPGAESRDWQGDAKTTSRQMTHRWINNVNNERDAGHQSRYFSTEHLNGESSVSKPPERRSTPVRFYYKLCIMNENVFGPLLSSCDGAQQALTAEIRQWLTASRKLCLQASSALCDSSTRRFSEARERLGRLDLTRVRRSVFLCPLSPLKSLFAKGIHEYVLVSMTVKPQLLPSQLEEQMYCQQVHPQWSVTLHTDSKGSSKYK